MKVFAADIGDAGQMHKLLEEFCADTKTPKPLPDFWLYNFPNPMFCCFYAKHGKKPVGLLWGHLRPYYQEHIFEVEGFFIRRGFRGKMRFVRGLVEDSVKKLQGMGAIKLSYVRPKKPKERRIPNG